MSERDDALTDLHDHLASMIDRTDGPEAGDRVPLRPKLSPPTTDVRVVRSAELFEFVLCADGFGTVHLRPGVQ